MNIGRDFEYKVENYKFKNFIHFNHEEVNLIWSWRNDPKIADWMTNAAIIPLESHIKFIDDLRSITDKLYWLVYKDSVPIGVLDVVNIEYDEMTGFLGYYLSPNFIDSGEGLGFNYYCRSFLFNMLNFKKLTGEIMVGNSRSFLISSFFNVKIDGVTERGGVKYLKMIANKDDFNLVSPQKIIRQFVRFVKQNPVNWDSILANVK